VCCRIDVSTSLSLQQREFEGFGCFTRKERRNVCGSGGSGCRCKVEFLAALSLLEQVLDEWTCCNKKKRI
jgi:hypothetical protein